MGLAEMYQMTKEYCKSIDNLEEALKIDRKSLRN
jgi:hypothetical protein